MTENTGRSWVEGANEPHGFGLNHLPYGAFRRDGKTSLCVRIGEDVLSLADCANQELFNEFPVDLRQACLQPKLNDFLALGPQSWQTLRTRIMALLGDSADADLRRKGSRCLYALVERELVLPLSIGNYTDFYASLDHARRVGEIFRPDNPLLPNYKHVPIAYHGRASSIIVSGTDIRRPWGQSRPRSDGAQPEFGPSTALDYEVELAFIVGQGNRLGEPIPIAEASQHLFGVALLNDWSARDIQAWEYQPLGPFLGKSFATSLSAWITPLAALEPFRTAAQQRSAGDPQSLPYLRDDTDQTIGALNIQVSSTISTVTSRADGWLPMPLSRTNTRSLYWTPAQMVAHHTCNGCNLQTGDILASGTLSGPELESAGCLLERTGNGAQPLKLSNGEHRSFLADDDQIILTASCERPGLQRLSFGPCGGRITAAR